AWTSDSCCEILFKFKNRLLDARAVSASYFRPVSTIKAISGTPIVRLVPSAPISEMRVLLAQLLRRDAEWRRGMSRRFRRASAAYEGVLPKEALHEFDFASSGSSLECIPWASGERHVRSVRLLE